MSDGILLLLFFIIIFLPIIANIIVHNNYNKYLKRNNRLNYSGAMTARLILDRNGLNHVTIQKGSGTLTDYYDPKKETVVLSPEVHDGLSISSLAIAAHETGHAIQHKEGYSFLKMRSALVPIVNFSSKLSTILIFLGLFLEIINLFDIGIILLSSGLLFHLITLPVEFNASKRAKEQLISYNIISNDEHVGIKKVLDAAAFTYISGFIAMALQIVRLMVLRNRD